MSNHPLYEEHMSLHEIWREKGLTKDQQDRVVELRQLRRAAFAQALADLYNYHNAEYVSACCDAGVIDLYENRNLERSPYTPEDFMK